MNFKIGDQVMHCRDGLAVIFSSTLISDNEYYLVRPNNGKGETVYVPKATADCIIRPIMNPSQADEVLKGIKCIEKIFNVNTKQRRDAFKKKLSSGNVHDIAYLYRLHYLFKENPEDIKLGPNDIEMLLTASNMFLDELSITYSIDRSVIDDFVISRIDSI